jgi:hypothetical protein
MQAQFPLVQSHSHLKGLLCGCHAAVCAGLPTVERDGAVWPEQCANTPVGGYCMSQVRVAGPLPQETLISCKLLL